MKKLLLLLLLTPFAAKAGCNMCYAKPVDDAMESEETVTATDLGGYDDSDDMGGYDYDYEENY